MLRVAFVVQRYGLEVCGGAELHCRWVAEHLAKHAEVHVITTTALDYLPWDDHYPEGEELINGVTVHRFAVREVRQQRPFDELTQRVFWGEHTLIDELEWVRMQGPYSPGLLQYIAAKRAEYDVFIFFTYQYMPTVFGIQIVPEKSVLVPTAHDHRTLYLDVYNHVFHLPRLIAYNTYAERDLVHWRFENQGVPGLVVGTGIDLPEEVDATRFRARHNLTSPYIVYVGRVEHAKGCGTLVEYFERYKREHDSDLRLVLMGKVEIPLPTRDDIVALGFVSDQDKFDGIAGSELVVLPSEHESLSMANLEAWAMGVPVLANGRCEVLKDNCLRSNGGLYYTSYAEFAACLDLLLGDSDLRGSLARQGQAYFEQNYGWDVIERRYSAFLAAIAE